MDIRAAAKELQDAEFEWVTAGSGDVPEIAEEDITDAQWVAAVGLLIAEEVPFDTAMDAVERNMAPILAARRNGFEVGEVAQHALMTLAPK